MAKMEPRWDSSNNRWECSIGSGKSRTWFRSKVEGEEGRALILAKRKAFLDGPAPLRPGSLEEFVETVWWPRIKQSCTLETQRLYRETLDRRVSHFYGRPMDSIRLEDLQPWVSSLTLSPKTVRSIFGILSGILELGYKTGRYPRQDHRLVVLPPVVKTKKEASPIESIRKIIEASQGTVLEGPVWTAAHLGLRRNEICGLKVPHVEIGKDCAKVIIQDNRQTCGETNKLKSKPVGQARVLHLPKWMGEKLLSFREPNAIYLFHADGKPIHPKRITNNMGAICKKAKVATINFHALRHACRANLSRAGVPEVVIMQILGHTDYQASLGYQGEEAGRQKDAFDKLASL